MKTKHKPLNPKTATCLVCNHIISLKRPVLYVAHDDDNVWKLSCRNIGHKMAHLKIMSLHQAIQFDASLNELLEMPPGVASQRSNPANNWEPFLIYPDTQR